MKRVERIVGRTPAFWQLFALPIVIASSMLLGCENKREAKVALPAEAPAAKSSEVAATPVSTEAVATNQVQAPATVPGSDSASQPSRETTTQPEIAPLEAVKTTPVSADALGRLTGEVAASRKSLLAFKQQGFIQVVKTKAGSVIKKGEVLATLDAQDFELRLDLAKARKEQGRVALASADKELRRERQLASENASTATALDRVQAQYDQAKLALKLAEIDVTSAERALDDTRLLAPYDCVVADQLKDEADYVRAGDPVFTVYDTQLPEIKFSAPERLMGKITVGDSLRVVVPSAGYSGQAQVVRVVPIINERTRTFQVIARPDAGDQKIVPGSYAEALLN